MPAAAVIRDLEGGEPDEATLKRYADPDTPEYAPEAPGRTHTGQRGHIRVLLCGQGQAVIKGMHISPYAFGNRFNHDETRDRSLLLHKREILKP